MENFSDYRISAVLYESPSSSVYRGRRSQDGAPVIIKALRKELPDPEEIKLLRYEYELHNSLQAAGVTEVLDFINQGNNKAIVFDDFGGESLQKVLAESSYSLLEKLQLSLKIVDALGKIHQENIAHKDINPTHIIFNQDTDQLKIIDFGTAEFTNSNNNSWDDTYSFTGTPAYMSPEQTGRVNRMLDYRTDFYSLGVTLYELFCDRLPFETNDTLEIIHAHIAQKPAEPNEIAPEVPRPLSEIIMKLLSKNVEDRYQSAWGVKLDLQECCRQLKDQGQVLPFVLASRDLSGRFQLSQKLYGREKEIQILENAFDRVAAGGKEIVLVSGDSGIGKTSLIREVFSSISGKKLYFISGAFDQVKQNIPYSALVSAFSELVQQLLSEGDQRLKQWRKELLDVFGPNGQVIIDVIPEVELIIGPQPEVPVLGPVETQNRFSLLFLNFMKVFCRPENPLVVFFDNMQWVDSASLNLIKLVMTDSGVKYLLGVGAYQEKDLDQDHLLPQAIQDFQEVGVVFNFCRLGPVKADDICRLIMDSLGTEKMRSDELAEIVMEKTGGNPFFVDAFLNSLFDKGVLSFTPPERNSDAQDMESGGWHWDMVRVQQMGITDNVAELLGKQIQELDKETGFILQAASCVGNKFDLQTLSVICEIEIYEVEDRINNALGAGLLIPIKEEMYVFGGEISEESNDFTAGCCFVHERIRQAAYSLLSASSKSKIHFKVGRYGLQKWKGKKRDENLFHIVNQFNLCNEYNEKLFKEIIVDLNLEAGQKAKSATAYEQAYYYLKKGIKLLDSNCWKVKYKQTLTLFVETSEVSYLCADYSEMETLSDKILSNARNLIDTVKIYEIKIDAYKAQYKLDEGIKNALIILKKLGVTFPENPKRYNIFLEYTKTKIALFNKNIRHLVDLPVMKNPHQISIMRVLKSGGSAAYFSNPSLLPLFVFKATQFSVRYGNAEESAFLYASYGLILCGVIGNIEHGYHFGKLALKVLEKMKAAKYKASTYHMVNAFIIHWKEHVRNTLNQFIEGYQGALETGDFEYAGHCAFFHSYYSFVAGVELYNILKLIQYYDCFVKRANQETSLYMFEICSQVVFNLSNNTKSPCSICGEFYNEERMLPYHRQANDLSTLFVYYINKLFLFYLFGNYSKAIEYSNQTEGYLKGVPGLIGVALFHFYDSLTRIALYADSEQSERQKILKRVAANQKKLKKFAKHAPMNHRHKYLLVEAETMRVLGKNSKAAELYDQAIHLAAENDYVNEEALANEQAAKFYLADKKTKIARTYMLDALACYQRWGATAKVKALEEGHNRLLSQGIHFLTSLAPGSSFASGMSPSKIGGQMDLASLVKASQAISGEIVLENLLNRLMKIVLENAGAQRGLLVLESEGSLLVAAEGTMDRDRVVLPNVPVNQSTALSAAMVHYVVRTQELLFLGNAVKEGLFTEDPYVQAKSPKSVLCLPVIHKSRLSGILYLENNITTDAFTAKHVEALELLSGQIASSLDNARLYKNLEESELRYRQLYENIIDMVLLVDDQDTVLMANPCFYNTIGIPDSPEKRHSFTEWVHPDDLSQVKTDLVEKLKSGHDINDFQFRLQDTDSRILEVECNARCITKEDELIGYQMVIRDITDRNRLQKDLITSLKNIQKAKSGTILGLAKLAEFRDAETGAHLERIQEYTKIIATELATTSEYESYVDEEYIEDIYFSSILHDIGKVGIPDNILLKPGKLTAEEFEVIKRHPVIGGEVLKGVDREVGQQSFLSMANEIAFFHHEKWNGTGYPKGLKGEEIPLSARIVGLADVYDALTTKRVYKEAFSHGKARRIIMEDRGKHFDPLVVDAFLATEEKFNRIRRELNY